MKLPPIIQLILEQRYINNLNGIKNSMNDTVLLEFIGEIGLAEPLERLAATGLERWLGEFGGEEVAAGAERAIGKAAGETAATSAERAAAKAASETAAKEINKAADTAAMKHIENGLKGDDLVDAVAKEIKAGSDSTKLQAAIDAAQRGEATIKTAGAKTTQKSVAAPPEAPTTKPDSIPEVEPSQPVTPKPKPTTKPKPEIQPKPELQPETVPETKPIGKPSIEDLPADETDIKTGEHEKTKTGEETQLKTKAKPKLRFREKLKTETETGKKIKIAPEETEFKPKTPPPPEFIPPIPPIPGFKLSSPNFGVYNPQGRALVVDVGLGAQQLGRYSTLFRQR